VRNYSEQTIEGREDHLRRFIVWCDERGLGRPGEITKPMLERYQRYLVTSPARGGKPMSFRSQYVRLAHIKGYFKWLTRQNVIGGNPAGELEMPRREHRLPAHVLTVSEVETVMASIDLRTPKGLRDRAILEVFYATGMRRMEVLHLRIEDVDAERGTVMVRQGKGKKDRLVPIGERALAWVEKYRRDARPGMVAGRDEGELFLTREGQGLTKARMTQLVRNIVIDAGVAKRGACHLFRHTMATLMLENGADVRVLQEMLGHAKLETTQIYTHVSMRKLCEVHAATHPGAKLGKRENASGDAGGAKAIVEELLERLDAESADDDE
jgi:integrase/recombinase XerD